jgi:two-component system, NtrC family, response regulator AtoC
MNKKTILIINEEAEVSYKLRQLLSASGYSNHREIAHPHVKAWLSQNDSPSLVFLNLKQSGSAGLKLITVVRDAVADVPVIVIGSSPQFRLIVEAVKFGAADYLIVPFDGDQVRRSVEGALEDKIHVETKSAVPEVPFPGVFANLEMKRACEIARMVARTDVAVLITGESGVGKEVFARYIHNQSVRSGKPFVKVNCAALPTDLLESELFGYDRGAFTGALNEKPGRFELADGGTILLDEIGEMSFQLQSKILHVLQDGEFSRLGGKRQMRVDARIIASTNRKLEEAVARGEFRDDLFFRLNVIRIKIPPLRERKQEIAHLSKYFVEKYREKYGSPVRELPQHILHSLLEYDWPGNVRQLENAIKRYLILPHLDMDIADFSVKPQAPERTEGSELLPPRQISPFSLPRSVTKDFGSLKKVGEMAAETAEREVVLWMLEETNWNRKLAARRLNICYKALLNKIKKWQMHRPPVVQPIRSRKRLPKVSPPEVSVPEAGQELAVHTLLSVHEAS